MNEIDSNEEGDDTTQVAQEITEEQLASNAVNQLETMKCKALQMKNDQLNKEKDNLRR